MKYCDRCHTTFPNEYSVCPKDQSVLRVTSELMQGMVLRGKYEILEKIGSGGMATVYKARHVAFNEVRAIKVVSSKLMDDDAFLARFKHEAVITRRLQHPNAVRVDDLDETEDGRPFIIMEFVEGCDLREVIQREGAMSAERALHIAIQVAAALQAAHTIGITHRDVKPDNILLIQQQSGLDFVKVLDFGIAKVREGPSDVTGISATKTGMVVGTPQYISPEQALGKHGDEIDGRADIYSLGVVLYEMLTGKLPFESDTPMGMLIAHIQAAPKPPREIRPDLNIPEPVSMILMKAMEKQKDQRFQTAGEMLAAMTNPEGWAAVRSAVPAGRQDATATLGSDVLSQLGIGPKAVPAPPPRPAQVVPITAAAPARSAAAAVAKPSVRPAVSAPASPRPLRRTPPPPEPSSRKWLVLVIVLVLLGGGGAAGYFLMYVPRAETAAPVAPAVKPVPEIEPDQRILGQVTRALSSSDDYKNVQIAVEDGVVTLSGYVRSHFSVEMAQRLATGFVGIREIRNEIAVGEPPKPAAAAKTVPAAAAPAPERTPVVERPKPAAPVPDRKRAKELVDRGNRQLEAGAYDAAIEAFQSALELDRGSAEARTGLRRAKEAKQAEEEILQDRQ